MVEKIDSVTTHVLSFNDYEIGSLFAALDMAGYNDISDKLFDAVYGDGDCDDDCGCGDATQTRQEEVTAQINKSCAELVINVDTSQVGAAIDSVRELADAIEHMQYLAENGTIRYNRVGDVVNMTIGGD